MASIGQAIAASLLQHVTAPRHATSHTACEHSTILLAVFMYLTDCARMVACWTDFLLQPLTDQVMMDGQDVNMGTSYIQSPSHDAVMCRMASPQEHNVAAIHCLTANVAILMR
jgi:hypothetical protein